MRLCSAWRPCAFNLCQSRVLSATPVFCVWLLSGCASIPAGDRDQQAAQTLSGATVVIERIPLTSAPFHGNVQIAEGFAWATRSSALGLHKTIRVDTKTYEPSELTRPFTAGHADLLVGAGSIWHSDGMTGVTGNGDLQRVDIATGQVIATIPAAGSPFAIDDGAVWAYNPRTRVLSAIGIQDNLVRRQIPTQGAVGTETFDYAAGSIWQFAHQEGVSVLELSRGAIPDAVVRRIDPQTQGIVSAIPIGPFRPTDRIRFVAGAIWLLGERDDGASPFAIRINVDSNTVSATIPLVRSMEHACARHAYPKTPVSFAGGIWVSTFCTDRGRMPGVLLKIDPASSQVTDELRLSVLEGHLGGQPALAAGEAELWGFDGRTAIRFGF